LHSPIEPEGGSSLESAKQLVKEEIEKLNKALKALEKLGGKKMKQARKMSAAARKRISLAQKKRWAKVRAGIR
jgi:hypothetical protein